MYNKEAHERATDAVEKSLSLRGQVRLGGKPFEPDDSFILLPPRCSEPVIEALQPLCPLRWERLADVTIGIGAGFSNMGEVCGGLAGGVIAIGLDIAARYRDTNAIRYLIIKFTQKLMREFAAEFGNVRCRELIGHDISGTLIPGDKAYEAYVKDSRKRRAGGREFPRRKLVRWVIMHPLPSEQEELHPPLFWTTETSLPTIGQIVADGEVRNNVTLFPF